MKLTPNTRINALVFAQGNLCIPIGDLNSTFQEVAQLYKDKINIDISPMLDETFSDGTLVQSNGHTFQVWCNAATGHSFIELLN
jgi:hypothetical protein